MGATYDEQDHSYTIGLALLIVVAIGAFAYSQWGIRTRRRTAA